MIELIKQIVKTEYTNEETKLKAIIDLLVSSERYSDYFVKQIQVPRKRKNDLILDLNAELSRALIALEKKGNIDPAWVASQIKEFYKNNPQINCNFKIKENE